MTSAASPGDRPVADPLPSVDVADWRRETKRFWQWSPPRSLLASVRAYERARRSGAWALGVPRVMAVLRHRWWSACCGAELPLGTAIEGGLLLPHPNGIVVHPEVRIGPNVLLFQQVTLGTGPRPGVPVLLGGVEVGAGAKILGGVTIGRRARVGANAVVLCDVPDGAVAVGVPARILSRDGGPGAAARSPTA